ncbi:putative DNA methylase [Nitrosomonas aestuarii]|uniref:Putative DNA methylase n=1 Tax=Nitrosomonas aestuarii TaxID=52441 RepID=A0A1I4D367_9PROT|nr:DUF1156 domain-containing protein [Nitrosomonas aestuarii]SFK87260.1 putative DNA methylase [Nitrosomonas aestuarii]
MANIKAPKKLIEVALPLDSINIASVNEKNPFLKGHPRSLHLWWARRPLAAARSILFAQLVNDPGGSRGHYPGMSKEKAGIERERLFNIIRELAKWENINNQELLADAHKEIVKSWEATCKMTGEDPSVLPPVLDPFSGGHAIPIEAQRLGIEPLGADLNPVAVTIGKALIEVPPKFHDKEPIGPTTESDKQTDLIGKWEGTKGLSEDIKRYGALLSDIAKRKIGHLYPSIRLPQEYGSVEADVMAWIWTKTVRCQNPACGAEVPLVRSFELSVKKGKRARIEPTVDRNSVPPSISFVVHMDDNQAGPGNVSRTGAKCLCCDSILPLKQVREEGRNGKIGKRLIAIVCESKKGRLYISPNNDHEMIAESAKPHIYPSSSLPDKALGFRVQQYGITSHSQLFTSRQLLALGTFCELLDDIRKQVFSDALKHGLDKGSALHAGGNGAEAYADSIVLYLSLAISQYTRYHCINTVWNKKNQNIAHAFGRQAIPMTWDFPESNPFSGPLTFITAAQWVSSSLKNVNSCIPGSSSQRDAGKNNDALGNVVISTDPPYYDNVGYADLSDFFYVWLRLGLKNILPSLYSTITVPKSDELVAEPFRHGGKAKAEAFFLHGMTDAMQKMVDMSHPMFPVTIYYAFKQSETSSAGTASSGWETFLEAVISAGFIIAGTWPINTEDATRLRSQNSNALASSIVLVCRKRELSSGSISRRQFQRELREQMPESLDAMIGGSEGASPIAPVDLAQAAIGPGIAIYSKYDSVLNQDGSPMSVHDALVLVNRAITDYLSPESGSFDADTQFCSNWFDQYGWSTGSFGEADTLARAKGTSVDGLREAGVVESGGGKVRLLKWTEYEADWDPTTDNRTPIWEACHQMIRSLNNQGESAAGELLAKMPEKGEPIRQLAYHLYTLCERKKSAEDARAYNELIGSWHAIVTASHEVGHIGSQTELELDF